MSEEPLFVLHRHPLANGTGWGKYHLAEAGGKSTLCRVRLRHITGLRYAKPVEVVLQSWEKRTSYYKKKGLCKTCIARAQKLRNPLDRLSEV